MYGSAHMCIRSVYLSPSVDFANMYLYVSQPKLASFYAFYREPLFSSLYLPYAITHNESWCFLGKRVIDPLQVILRFPPAIVDPFGHLQRDQHHLVHTLYVHTVGRCLFVYCLLRFGLHAWALSIESYCSVLSFTFLLIQFLFFVFFKCIFPPSRQLLVGNHATCFKHGLIFLSLQHNSKQEAKCDCSQLILSSTQFSFLIFLVNGSYLLPRGKEKLLCALENGTQ